MNKFLIAFAYLRISVIVENKQNDSQYEEVLAFKVNRKHFYPKMKTNFHNTPFFILMHLIQTPILI
jgi:hypothetical protein